MGEYGGSVERLMTGDGNTLFGRYKQHYSGKQPLSNLFLLESLRDLHSDRAVTYDEGNPDPIRFADAGFADARLVRDGNRFMEYHNYVPEKNRLIGGDGRVDQTVVFGQYEYTFEGRTSVVYSVRCREPNGSITQYHYYVSPKDDPDSTWAKSIVRAAGKWAHELHDEVWVFDNNRWRKSKQLWDAVGTASWDDVILDPAMKAALIDDIGGFFDSRETYEAYRVPWKRGIIIHGTPGCGKTISVKALMRTMQARDVVSLYVKSLANEQARASNDSIRSIFQHARRMAPCMLLFEDLDSLVGDGVRSYFLNEVDGLEANHGILMIGSTNHLARLDPAISKRPSRFDRKYHFTLPGERERLLYCDYWREKLRANDQLDFSPDVAALVTRLTDGFSYAYLKELFVQTLLTLVSGRALPDPVVDVPVTDVDAATAAAAAPKSRMPDVEIPAHLRSNRLVQTLYPQVRALWKDMDNTGDTAEAGTKTAA